MMRWKNKHKRKFQRLHGFNRNRRSYIGKDKINEFIQKFNQLEIEAKSSAIALRQLSDAAVSFFSYYPAFDKELFLLHLSQHYGGTILCVSKQ